MAIESLNGEASAHIPNGERTISRATNKEISERLESKTVNRIGMRAILLSSFDGVQIKKLDSTIPVTTQNKVSGVVELDLPDRGSRHVLESVSNAA